MESSAVHISLYFVSLPYMLQLMSGYSNFPLTNTYYQITWLSTDGSIEQPAVAQYNIELFAGEYAGTQGLGLLRLHSTYRHDLKIYASDEGRVQMTAAAFAKGLLALEVGTARPGSISSQISRP